MIGFDWKNKRKLPPMQPDFATYSDGEWEQVFSPSADIEITLKSKAGEGAFDTLEMFKPMQGREGLVIPRTYWADHRYEWSRFPGNDMYMLLAFIDGEDGEITFRNCNLITDDSLGGLYLQQRWGVPGNNRCMFFNTEGGVQIVATDSYLILLGELGHKWGRGYINLLKYHKSFKVGVLAEFHYNHALQFWSECGIVEVGAANV